MQSIRYVLAALTLPLVACAHQEQAPPPQDRVVPAVATPPPSPPQAPMPDTAFQAEAPAARPRLTKTVTLGQSEDGYAQPAAAPAAGGPTVIVNNNIYVNGSAPPAYGGYYYGGYGGYGGRANGTGSQGTYAPSQGNYGSSFGGYSNTGPRTAAPGQTPGVGGNWSPAPSYGPRQMR
ncbi:MAG TPA: hypothetical protein VIF62_09920 [Labilithrix sp.]